MFSLSQYLFVCIKPIGSLNSLYKLLHSCILEHKLQCSFANKHE